jgi:ATP-binding cassette, subfamily C (CFTR/MRP), member 1
MLAALWLNIWTAANGEHPDSRVGYYVGIYVMFGVLNVLFMAAEFWTFMVVIVPHSAKVLHRKILVAAMQYVYIVMPPFILAFY